MRSLLKPFEDAGNAAKKMLRSKMGQNIEGGLRSANPAAYKQARNGGMRNKKIVDYFTNKKFKNTA